MIYFSDAKSNNAHAPPAGGGGPSSYPPVSNSANYGAQQQMVSYARFLIIRPKMLRPCLDSTPKISYALFKVHPLDIMSLNILRLTLKIVSLKDV